MPILVPVPVLIPGRSADGYPVPYRYGRVHPEPYPYLDKSLDASRGVGQGPSVF